MDRSAVAAIVEKHLPALRRRFGLERWAIRLDYDAEPAGEGYLTRGRCERLIDYDEAAISLNPDALDSEAAVLQTLRHELFHVVLGPIDLYIATVEDLLPDPAEPARVLLERVKGHALERTVSALERLYAGVTGHDAGDPRPGPDRPDPEPSPNGTLVYVT